jgi:hypothetical protein
LIRTLSPTTSSLSFPILVLGPTLFSESLSTLSNLPSPIFKAVHCRVSQLTEHMLLLSPLQSTPGVSGTSVTHFDMCPLLCYLYLELIGKWLMEGLGRMSGISMYWHVLHWECFLWCYHIIHSRYKLQSSEIPSFSSRHEHGLARDAGTLDSTGIYKERVDL